MTNHNEFCLITEEVEPLTFQEVLNGLDASQRMTTMHEEMEALHRNKTCDLVQLPKGSKAIEKKWIYKIKCDVNDQVEQYRANW